MKTNILQEIANALEGSFWCSDEELKEVLIELISERRRKIQQET